jgi:hypothetical protein
VVPALAGPVGAPFGPSIGAEAGIESPQQKTHDDIKKIYGLDIHELYRDRIQLFDPTGGLEWITSLIT